MIVDLPIRNGGFPWLCKRLPEGNKDGWLQRGLEGMDFSVPQSAVSVLALNVTWEEDMLGGFEV